MTLTDQPYVCLTPYEETLLSRGACLADIERRRNRPWIGNVPWIHAEKADEDGNIKAICECGWESEVTRNDDLGVKMLRILARDHRLVHCFNQ